MNALRVLGAVEHEALCRRCGMSCHTPVWIGDEQVILPELHCRFLGHAGALSHCTVYERRFEMAPWCRTSAEAIEIGALASDCPYTAGIAGYRGKRWATDWERAAIVPQLRASILVNGLSLEDNPEAALRLLQADGDCWSYEIEGDVYRYRKSVAHVP